MRLCHASSAVHGGQHDICITHDSRMRLFGRYCEKHVPMMNVKQLVLYRGLDQHCRMCDLHFFYRRPHAFKYENYILLESTAYIGFQTLNLEP